MRSVFLDRGKHRVANLTDARPDALGQRCLPVSVKYPEDRIVDVVIVDDLRRRPTCRRHHLLPT
ncbi:MAG: hypothetical protein JWL79_3860 [Frankiales bacterium]|nr:hypothetical protein [Frankiales bacterium]